jgi:FlaG protein
MSDTKPQPIAPVEGVAKAPAVQPVRAERPAAIPVESHPATPDHETAAAATGGTLPASYAQFIVNQDTHDVIIRIRDSATDRVINEYPSEQVEELAKYMQTYAEALAKHRRSGTSN